MKIPSAARRVRTLALLVALAAIVPTAVGDGAVGRVLAQDGRDGGTFLERPDPRHERCVRDTEYMRFHHWELLRELRDAAVRDGRPGEIRFAGCRECHPNRERFCNRCHGAVNLSPDCFGCHYYPETAQAPGAGAPDAGPRTPDDAVEPAGSGPAGSED